MALLGLFTYWLLPEGIKFLFNFVNIISFFAMPIEAWASGFPIEDINMLLMQSHISYQITALIIAKSVVEIFLGYIITCFTLPIRSICWTLWYKSLNKGEKELDKRILKRATEERGNRKLGTVGRDCYPASHERFLIIALPRPL